MRRLAGENVETARKVLQSLQGATIGFYPEEEVCDECGRKLQVYKTQTRSIVTLAYGSIEARETVLFCPGGCTSPDGELRLYRCQLLEQLVAPRQTYGFDLLAKVGLLRFLECRQRLEIKEELRKSYGLSIPEGTIQELICRFVDAIRALHDEKVPELRKSFEAGGGYVLHVDGTCEEGSQVHFACLTGPEPMVLWSAKIESENTVQIRGVLQDVEKRFGKPAGTVEDLSVPIHNAVLEQWPGLPVFYCHQHFLSAVGKDLLGDHYNRLRGVLRNSKIRPEVRGFLKNVRKELGDRGDEARRICQHFEDLGFLKSKERSLKATAVGGGIAEWILSAPAEGTGRGFPFDLQHLSFYLRARHGLDVLDERVLPSLTGHTPRGEKLLFRLRGILHTFFKSTAMARKARELQDANALFRRLREALRLAAEDSGQGMNEELCYRNPEEVEKAEKTLRKLREELRRELQSGSPPPERSRSVGIVVKYLDKYWDGLFGHCLALHDDKKRHIMVQRTNNMAEGFFRRVKRFGRRVTGKKKLNREVDALPGHALLVFNLKTPEYVKIVCGGSLDRLPEALAKLSQEGKFPRASGKECAASILDRKTRRRPDFPDKLAAAFGGV